MRVHVAPPSEERQMPRAYADAYSVFASEGSNTTRRTPRGEHGVTLFTSLESPVQPAVVAAPLKMKFQLAPPSVDL
jgi:hypothetical protein